MRDFTLYLKDIVEAIASIESFVEGMDEKAFLSDDKTRSAVVRKLEIIGEAVKNLPESIKESAQNLSWTEMAGMRDRLIHAYFGVDYALVWKTVKGRLPEVKRVISDILKTGR